MYLALVLAFSGGCASQSVVPSPRQPATPGMPALETYPAAEVCPGVVVPTLLVHIDASGATTGEIVDSSDDAAPTMRTFRLRWPHGYGLRSDSGITAVVDREGNQVAVDGQTLTAVEVCAVRTDELLLGDPLALRDNT